MQTSFITPCTRRKSACGHPFVAARAGASTRRQTVKMTLIVRRVPRRIDLSTVLMNSMTFSTGQKWKKDPCSGSLQCQPLDQQEPISKEPKPMASLRLEWRVSARRDCS